jgi:hypothetical protein
VLKIFSSVSTVSESVLIELSDVPSSLSIFTMDTQQLCEVMLLRLSLASGHCVSMLASHTSITHMHTCMFSILTFKRVFCVVFQCSLTFS